VPVSLAAYFYRISNQDVIPSTFASLALPPNGERHHLLHNSTATTQFEPPPMQRRHVVADSHSHSHQRAFFRWRSDAIIDAGKHHPNPDKCAYEYTGDAEIETTRETCRIFTATTATALELFADLLFQALYFSTHAQELKKELNNADANEILVTVSANKNTLVIEFNLVNIQPIHFSTVVTFEQNSFRRQFGIFA
jgi:hypothetical protein